MKKQLLVLGVISALIICILAAGCTETAPDIADAYGKWEYTSSNISEQVTIDENGEWKLTVIAVPTNMIATVGSGKWVASKNINGKYVYKLIEDGGNIPYNFVVSDDKKSITFISEGEPLSLPFTLKKVEEFTYQSPKTLTSLNLTGEKVAGERTVYSGDQEYQLAIEDNGLVILYEKDSSEPLFSGYIDSIVDDGYSKYYTHYHVTPFTYDVNEMWVNYYPDKDIIHFRLNDDSGKFYSFSTQTSEKDSQKLDSKKEDTEKEEEDKDSGKTKTTDTTKEDTTKSSTDSSKTKTTDTTKEDTTKSSTDSSKTKTTDTTKSSPTTGEENALKKAKLYLEYKEFSYQGLIMQLMFDEFSEKEAKYGADNCGADWNKMAKKCAESYMKVYSFSKEEILKLLEKDGFTPDEATYGAESVSSK